MHRAISENIGYGRADATRPRSRTAARRAAAHDFIVEVADPRGAGYDAQVGSAA